MRGRAEGTRRRARAGSPDRRSRTDGEVEDAWAAYLQRESGRQVPDLPGPFGVSSVRQEQASPSHMEQGLGGGSGPRGGVDVPVVTPTRPRPGEPGSVGTLSSNSGNAQPAKRVYTGNFASQDGPRNEPGVASTSLGAVNLEQQLSTIAQAVTALQSQLAEQHAAFEQRLVAVESNRSVPVQSEFGAQYRGSAQSGSSDFQRLGSPIRSQRRPGGGSPVDGGEWGRLPDRDDRDVFSKSEKWLPSPPTPQCDKWTNRESEIEGFFSYVQALRAWSQLASDRMATEIQQAIKWPHEIVTSTLTPGQQSRSSRLFALLRVAFAGHVRTDSLIRAYEAGCGIHNSPPKPFGSCGYELLRVLALEFSLRTRTEAICLRAELLRKEFRVDTKGIHVVTDLVRAIQVSVNRYDRLTETLPSDINREDLRIGPSDLALLFIRNLPYEAKQFVLLHSEDESWQAIQNAALKFERQQRLYTELGAFSKKFVNEVAVEGSSNETKDEVSAVQGGCSRCGKKNHDSSSCKTDLSKTTCFKCGSKGHIGRNCRNPNKGNKGPKGGNDGKGSQADPKAKAQATSKSKGKGKSGKGSGGKGKGKMFEVGDEQSWEGWDETSGEQGEATQADEGGESLAMSLLGGCLSGQCDCEFDLVWDESMMSGSVSPLSLQCGLRCPFGADECLDESWYDGLVCGSSLCEPLLSSSVAFSSDDQGWWLVDSGASVTVLSEKSLHFFEVLEVEEVPKGPKFFAANGSQVTMNQKVKVKAFIALETKRGEQVVHEIKLSALVGETRNNILSTTQLVNKGWFLELNKVSKMVHGESGSFAVLSSWSGCPWVYLQRTRDGNKSQIRAVLPPGNETEEMETLAPVQRSVWKQTDADEMHRARGHTPFDPHCIICQRTKSVSQHRRKKPDGSGDSIIEISADFFFWKGLKFLLICEQFSRMIGCVYMDPSTDVVRASVKKWLLEMGCLGNGGVLNVFTDDESAVGAVFFHLGIGKDVKLDKCPPQSQAMNGLAERSVRAVKESLLCVTEELRDKGLEICETGKAVGVALEYVCFMLNMHTSVHGSSKSPQEFLSGKRVPVPTTSAYGAVVLCELPAAWQSESRPRWLEGGYLRPDFSSLGCICRVLLDGVVREVRPKAIRLVLPLRWEQALLVDLVKPIAGPGPGVLRDSERGVAVEGEICGDSGALRLSLEPPTERAVCPKSGPPMSWFKEYRVYTTGCSACEAIQRGIGRQGKVHSAACRSKYVDWLKSQRQVVSEKALSAESGFDPAGLAGHEDEERIGGGEPPESWFDANGGYTSECPACSALELGQSTTGLRHSDVCRARFSRWLRESRSVPPLPSAGGFSVPEALPAWVDEVPPEVEYSPSIAPKGGQDMDLDGSGVPSSSKGVKRAAETELKPETVEKEVPLGSGGSRKRALETEDSMEVISVANDCSHVFPLCNLDRVWTSPDVVFDTEKEMNSVVFRGSSRFEDVTFDGKVLRVWKPDHGIDDTTSEILDGEHTFQGMLTEVANMNRVNAGTPLKQAEAEKLAKQFNIKIIQCRWVSNAKIIEGNPGVRARIVVKDIAGDSKAKALGLSSPTPSSESIKTAIAVAGFSDAHVTTLDCSAAFMHTPLDEDKRKIIVKLPLSVSWADESGSPVYLLLKKSLNGIRSASLDWLQFAQSLVKRPMNLCASPTDPCVFTAMGTIMIIYVDDIIIVSKDGEVGKRVQALLNEHVPTKLTGVLKPSASGQLKFVGRVIRRIEGSGNLLVSVLPGYLDSCFGDYGLSKLKTGKAAVPNLRETIDGEPGKKLSQESYTKFRRCLGKLAWMSQTREDLHIFVAYLATGQHAPDERYEKAMKQVLRFLLLDGEWELIFPGANLENVDLKLITVFCDASHAPMHLTQRKGISGAFYFVLNSLIKGFSRHQGCVSLSSCESELFSIQEAVQEAVGLLPMVRKLVYDYFGNFQGYEGKTFPIHLLTDSESGRQLLESMDVPRKSRHTEVRIFWVREQMSRFVSVSWISGELNLSDILTKCSSFHFVHRSTIGFTPVGPAQLSTLSAVKGVSKTGKPALILVELCCQENSALMRKSTPFAYFGITPDAETQRTVDEVRELVERASAAARRECMVPHVHVHVSCPCPSGSPIRFLSGMNQEGDDVRFGELEPILAKLKQYRKLANTMSLEWPLRNTLWGLPGVKSLLADLGLEREAIVRLCRMGVCLEAETRLPIGKRLRFVSDSEAMCRPLRRFQACDCTEHAPFNKVNWSKTAYYNDQLARVLNSAFKAAMSAR